jgi:hypothetical protein
MKDDAYLRASINTALNDQAEASEVVNPGSIDVTYLIGMRTLAIQLDELKEAAKLDFLSASDIFEELAARITEADTIEQFQSILDDLNDINDSYNILLQTIDRLNNFVTTVDSVTKDFVGRMYDAIQQLRKRVYENTRNGKYGITWPQGSITIVNKYFPGKIFDNYQPTQ